MTGLKEIYFVTLSLPRGIPLTCCVYALDRANSVSSTLGSDRVKGDNFLTLSWGLPLTSKIVGVRQSKIYQVLLGVTLREIIWTPKGSPFDE